jgi:hypothetical protein
MEGVIKYLVPSTLGIGLIEGYNQIGLAKNVSKPQLRREVSILLFVPSLNFLTPLRCPLDRAQDGASLPGHLDKKRHASPEHRPIQGDVHHCKEGI